MLSPMAEKKKQQEVPDELPSLAEDILKDEEGVKQEEGGIPEELPPLDDELLGELEGEASAELSPPAPKGQKPVDSESYFGSLVKDLEKNPRIPHDFLSEMKTFWKGHGVEEKPLDTEIKTSYELDLDKDVQEKVRQLQALESQWKQQKDGLERARLQVENTEIEITLRSEFLADSPEWRIFSAMRPIVICVQTIVAATLTSASRDASASCARRRAAGE